MQDYQIKVTAKTSITLLERILRVIRHRGATVYYFNAYQNQNMMQIEVGFCSKRTLLYITRQLQKLIDIQSIEPISADNHIKIKK